MVWFLSKPLSREEARQKYFEAIRGRGNCDVARAIERRIPLLSADQQWARGVRLAYSRYARHLTESEKSLQHSQRLALLDPDAGRRLAL